MNFFVTGTDTDAGKTFVTALLTRSLRKAGFDTVAMKPVSCGEPGDTAEIRAAAENELSSGEVTPVAYKAPLAPIEAARLEGRTFDPKEVLTVFRHLRSTHLSLLVEGVGDGWCRWPPATPPPISPRRWDCLFCSSSETASVV